MLRPEGQTEVGGRRLWLPEHRPVRGPCSCLPCFPRAQLLQGSLSWVPCCHFYFLYPGSASTARASTTLGGTVTCAVAGCAPAPAAAPGAPTWSSSPACPARGSAGSRRQTPSPHRCLNKRASKYQQPGGVGGGGGGGDGLERARKYQPGGEGGKDCLKHTKEEMEVGQQRT